ncbi:MAG: hypothetical protein HRT66_09060 [Flavobacteriaceae bacterium]|nr:hypothetical protein [Flavobacteriaceae bacterium]
MSELNTILKEVFKVFVRGWFNYYRLVNIRKLLLGIY